MRRRILGRFSLDMKLQHCGKFETSACDPLNCVRYAEYYAGIALYNAIREAYNNGEIEKIEGEMVGSVKIHGVFPTIEDSTVVTYCENGEAPEDYSHSIGFCVGGGGGEKLFRVWLGKKFEEMLREDKKPLCIVSCFGGGQDYMQRMKRKIVKGKKQVFRNDKREPTAEEELESRIENLEVRCVLPDDFDNL